MIADKIKNARTILYYITIIILTGLMKYRNKSFWEGNKTIIFDTLTGRHQYEVIAVFKTVIYTNR